MGGDSFEGTEKLTDQQYKILVPQILQILQPLYIRAESYIPLPEKEIHGDIDFLMILKPQVTLKSIVQALKIERFIINNNDTINSVYKNKQVDFCIKSNDRSFETAKFYKSYSGIGAHLGIFLNSKQIKLSDTGLYALAFKEHIKFQFLLTDSIEEILKFYGLSHERYFQGFATRKDLFQYLRDCCFMNQKTMIEHDCKNQSKLTKFFTQYLKSQTNIRQTSKIQLTNHLTQTLQYFKKQQQFNTEFANLLTSVTRKQELNKKFNAVHIIERFKVKPKQVNKLKQQFRSHFQNEQEYQKYIQNSKLEDILDMFEKVVKLCDKEDGGDKVGDDGGQQKWQLGVTKKERRANRRKQEKQQKQMKKQEHKDEVGISLQEKINEQTTIPKVEEK